MEGDVSRGRRRCIPAMGERLWICEGVEGEMGRDASLGPVYDSNGILFVGVGDDVLVAMQLFVARPVNMNGTSTRHYDPCSCVGGRGGDWRTWKRIGP